MHSSDPAARAPLRVLLQDHDATELEQRTALLRESIPAVSIDAFNGRREFLAHIAALMPHERGTRWTLALIDLVHDARTAPGMHLLQTINEHPGLRDRVAPVAFTRYGHDDHTRVLEAQGARAILSPEALVANSDDLGEVIAALDLVAAGAQTLIRIGVARSRNDDVAFIERMSELFPSLDEEYESGSQAQWTRAMWILLVCKLFEAGYSQTAVLAQLGVGRAQIERLRAELENNEHAIAAHVILPGGTTVDLGRVIRALEPHIGQSKAVWELMPPREKLDGASRLKWITNQVYDLFPADPEEPAPGFPLDREPWIPREYISWLRRFIYDYNRLRGGKHKDPASEVQQAIENVARQFSITTEHARHAIVHAVMCLEETAKDPRSAATTT